MDVCVDVGERAGKEYNIETSMSKMKNDWEGVEFRLIAFKKTGTFSVAGFDDVNIGETVACPDNPEALPLIKVDEPTLQMTFCVNDSPFAGKEGKFVTSRQLRDRLQKELLTNVALRVEETDSPDSYIVKGLCI